MKPEPCYPCPHINKPCDVRQVGAGCKGGPMNRHKAAVFAQWRYAHEYETGTSPDKIFEALDPHQKACCRMAVNDIMAAPNETTDIDDDHMSCIYCGHIAQIDDAYCTETMGDEDFPICPKCGEWNVGGYPSYAMWGLWSEDDREIIRSVGLDR